jgi:HEAT repeat protein
MRSLGDLLEQLSAPAWDARVDAVQKLSERPEANVLNALTSALYDEDTAVVRAATQALLRRGDTAAFEPLLRALNASGSDADVAEEVQDVLAHRPEPWFVRECIAAVEESDDVEIRAFAAEALGYPLRATESVETLEQALSDGSASVRDAAEEALAHLRRRDSDSVPG